MNCGNKALLEVAFERRLLGESYRVHVLGKVALGSHRQPTRQSY